MEKVNEEKIAWNKGLTKKTSPEVLKQAEKLKLYYKEHDSPFKGKKHTEETKKRISESRKKYLKEHPEKVPFKLNHSSKESFPEKYFKKWLKKEKIFEKQELQIDRYTLDFAWPDKKIYLEIDGSQHKLNWMIGHDKERTTYLNTLGWTCIGRVDWSAFQKLTKKEKHSYLTEIKSAIIETRIIEKFISKKDQKELIREEWKTQGKINSLGRAVGSMLSTTEWDERFKKIINSGVDLTKFGWKTKITQCTDLTIFEVELTFRHFKEYFTGKIYIHKSLGKKKK